MKLKTTQLNFILSLIGMVFFSTAHAQNTCDTAELITAGTHTVTTIDGSEVPDPICAINGAGASNGEWYTYIPAQDYSVTITTDLEENSGGDTRFHVYTGDCSNLTCFAGDDDGGNIGNGYLSIDTFNVIQGTTYYIAFDDRWNDLGFVFQLTEGDVVEEPTNPVAFSESSLSSFSGSQSCVVDMNNDHLDDIVRVSSSQVNINFQNAGGGFTEQTFSPSPQQQNTPSWSIAAGDINGDGYNDLLLGGGSRVTFVYNNAASSFTSDNSNTSYIFCQRSTFSDIDNDGDLDSFICHDVDQSWPFRNDGSGNLTLDQSLIQTADLAGNYAAIWIDYDNDRDNDLYITKCRQGSSEGDPERTNLMYRNNGNGTYTEVAASLGIDDNNQNWSTVFDDLDNDGDLDAFIVTHSGGSNAFNRYFRNNLIETGTADFTDIIGATGIPTDDLGAWENIAADFDNDGDLDILTEFNHQLFLNNGNNTYTGQVLNVDEGGVGDLDNDGDLDIVNGNTLYTNTSNNSNNWLKINTIGVASNLNGIGARVEITTPDNITQIREVRSGEGFSHMSSLTTHFGIGTNPTITSLSIFWPSGTIDVFSNVSINQTLDIIEGQTLSLEDVLIDNLITYPNPTRDVINLNTSMITENAIYTVFDITGKRVLNAKLDSETIDVSNLNEGNYILRIFADGKQKTQKFIKI